MTPSTADGRRGARLRTALVTTGLITLTACAVVIPPVLARSTTSSLDAAAAGSAQAPDASAAAELARSSPAGLAALAAASTQAGKAYRWGGTGPDEWDCSGLVQWAFRQAGVELPRVSEDQALVGSQIPLTALAPGDVITFRTADHVGIYAGSGLVFNAYDAGVPIGLMPLAELPPINNIRRF
ncbi:C40 family peptidase [Rhodococcus sp. NPDC058514]|uniref:C40 family peptidase n=1 Tax=unclassified Rhodococcus (in: high G+C Gram-positive bacteria) TaxID=192944 RepID=UPI00364D8150